MKISHSKVEVYTVCPAKYRFKYVEKLEADKTYSALLFGGAIDQALNYILSRKKHNHIIYEETAINIFNKSMAKWQGQNELVYFKNECPEFDLDWYGVIPFEECENKQEQVWSHLCNIGELIIIAYITEVLPQFKQVISVQTRKSIPNEEGDELILITDFVAELQDGRIVLFDNKTTGDVKKSYPKTAVKKSSQLAIYSEFENTEWAGYIALQKKLKDDKVVWNMIIDKVPEEMKEKAFDNIDAAMRGIKKEEFPTNQKGCFSFGRKCEYWNYCKNNDDTGLIKRK